MQRAHANHIMLLAGLACLSGCLAVGGSKTVAPASMNPTIGQQLIDLKAALDKGAMTQTEYDTERTRVLQAPVLPPPPPPPPAPPVAPASAR